MTPDTKPSVHPEPPLRNCHSCRFSLMLDGQHTCCNLDDAAADLAPWMHVDGTDESGMPAPEADGCGGWSSKDEEVTP